MEHAVLELGVVAIHEQKHHPPTCMDRQGDANKPRDWPKIINGW